MLRRSSASSGAFLKLTRKASSSSGSNDDIQPTGMWFGVPLESLPTSTDRSRQVPQLLGEIRRQLEEQDGLDREGVFRTSPQVQLANFIRVRLEAGEDPEHVLTGCGTDVLTTLLKQWLRDLPGGIWPQTPAPELAAPKSPRRQPPRRVFSRGTSFSDNSASVETSSVPMETDLQELLAMENLSTSRLYGLLKRMLSPAQTEVLLWLLDLLVDAVGHESSSRMNAQALGVVFSPVFAPIEDDMAGDEQLRRTRDGAALCERLIVLHRQGQLTGRPNLSIATPETEICVHRRKTDLEESSSTSTGVTLNAVCDASLSGSPFKIRRSNSSLAT